MIVTRAIRCSLLVWCARPVAGAWDARYTETGIVNELGSRLSEGAGIVLKGEDGFKEKTERWQSWKSPDVAAVVDIRYANANNIPFLAKSGGHGAISSLVKFKNGIQINMRGLNSISIAKDGSSATLGGGMKGKEIIDFLWAREKQTVTGVCECTGHTAVVLGGGHGLLQGFHGLPSDQLLSARIVIANSTALTASPTENSDLFWALRGAGHNFGIVTSLQYKIYDIDGHPGGKTWSYKALAFPATPENVRKVYSIAESQLDKQPEGMMQYSLVMTNPQVSPDPIILHHVVWNGPLTSPLATRLTKAYHELKPLGATQETGTYLDVARWMQVDADGTVCNTQKMLPGAGVIRFPVDVKTYHLDALVASIEKFIKLTKSVAEFSGSFMMVEQYSTHTVRDIAAKDSAFASRDARVLISPAFFYPSVVVESGERNKALDKMALQYGQEIRKILVEGAKKSGGSHAYVNYAFGGESEKELYGRDKIEKLRMLKRVYDPENRFGFYGPIKSAKKSKGHNEL
ncbi:hypothetical protein K458DRAFT_289299 [Lentithecium fluviatile CBS 122367]|uniref:FAD-binding PCMH-type domain-containing protein n=1 Tax=Lentithecium fluviatile CBS 122367 TaxID=1168545 RepID=A0A6G1JJK6_9PLEO|nr:hypothetical protein K458DRAFT_289299 [Lentithecium fluviatile CBS 122367]